MNIKLIILALFVSLHGYQSFAMDGSLNEFDRQEQQGVLHPEKTKLLDFNFAKLDSPQENKEHTKIVATKYLDIASKWPDEDKMSRDYARAIGASFTWLNLYNPSLIHKIEPFISKLIKSEKLVFADLWLENLPRANARYENGKLFYERTILQFNKRFLCDFKGHSLLIGAGHASHLRKNGEPYYDANHNPTFTSSGEIRYALDIEGYYTLDIDSTVDPDVIGNAKIDYNISPFPDNRFKKIIFNYISHADLLNSEAMMKQYNRVLENKGILEFKGRHHRDAQKEFSLDSSRIHEVLESVNFKINEFSVKKDIDAPLCGESLEEDKNFIYLRAVKIDKK